MDANILRQQQQQQQQLNSGLMRYRSAPSTLLANFIDGGDCGTEGCDDFIPSHHHRSSSPEGESIFARFMNCGGDDSGSEIREDKSPAAVSATATATTTATTTTNSNNNSNRNCQFMGGGSGMEHGSQEQQNGFSQMMYHQTPPPPPPPRPQQQAHVMSHHHRHSSSSSNPHENAYRVVSSMGMDQQVKMESGNNSSNLIRHSSSPAGLFSHLNVENGYGVMRGMGNFRTVSGGSNGDSTTGSSCRLKGQMNFSSGPPSSSSGLMSQISEIGSESIVGASNGDGGSMANGNATNRYLHSFQVGSWEDSALENIPGLKRARDVGNKMMSGLNSSESQNGDVGNHTSGLTHHFSLPKTSAEMAAILQFQDSVPCKIRAKRGCATHPRSIAERVRRTRISERMRKLQELVPNMDKQTNTADMLDLAVDYIKDLQKQVKTLSESRANCTCSSKQKAY